MSLVKEGCVHFAKHLLSFICIFIVANPGCIAPHTQLRILGVELDSPAYKALKEGDIKLFDVITELNEERVTMGVLFRQNTRDKTRPELTLKRNRNTPSIKTLLTKGITLMA